MLVFFSYFHSKVYTLYLFVRLLAFLYPQQFVYVDFEESCNLDKCLHRWLAGIGTPFTHCSRGTLQLLG